LSMLIGVIIANFNKHKIKISTNILCSLMPEKIKHIYKNVLLQIIGLGFSLMSFLFST